MGDEGGGCDEVEAASAGERGGVEAVAWYWACPPPLHPWSPDSTPRVCSSSQERRSTEPPPLEGRLIDETPVLNCRLVAHGGQH